MTPVALHRRSSVQQVEEGVLPAPAFDEHGRQPARSRDHFVAQMIRKNPRGDPAPVYERAFVDRLRTGFESAVLGCIDDADVELALWRRSLNAELSQWLDELPVACLPHLPVPVQVVDLVPAVHAACHAAGTPPGPMCDALLDDIAALACRFARIARSARLRVRLEVVNNNSCRRLHRDCLPLRLLCTYRGPGTVWVPPTHAAQALAAAADDYDGPFDHSATHDVAIFKGCGFAGQAYDSGIVHRSPRIEGSAITRLVLCLDPALEPAT